MRRLKWKANRRGSITVITAILFLSLTGIAAVSIDFGRLWTLRNELQTSADAAAMAGAIQLVPGRVRTLARDSANAFALRNPAMTRTVTVDSNVLGIWNDSTRIFTPDSVTYNAINVVVGSSMRGLIMSAFGVPSPRLRARAIGWGSAPVGTDACTKPWAIPYEVLMLALNRFRGIPSTNANLNRPFDQIADVAALAQMTVAQRTFLLKLGQNNNANNGGINQTAADSVNMPGNFQAVRLGKLWDAASSTYPTPGPQSGGNTYRNNISGANGCYSIAPNDSLQTETGNKKGPTNQGLIAFCPQLSGNLCLDANGNQTVTVASSFYKCGTGCTGQSTVAIKLLGAFILASFDQGSGNLTGIFRPIQRAGPVGGGGNTLLVKPILAR